MKVLVTGAAGFLGRHVCEALIESGHDITGMDALPGKAPTGAVVWLDRDVTRISHDDVPPGIEAVIHMAAIASPKTCDASPPLAFNVNVNGTYQMLKLAVEAGAKKFIFVSSAHVYGITPSYMPTDERHPLWPQDTYTVTKILGERLCQLYYENHGLSYTTLRLFNVYGPGQALGYFIPDMIAKAEALRDVNADPAGNITLGGANTVKDFVHVDDAARAFVAAVESPYVGPINIGSGIPVELGSVLGHIGREMRVDVVLNNAPSTTRMQSDWSRAKQVLGWEPTMSLEEGLRGTIKSAQTRHLVP